MTDLNFSENLSIDLDNLHQEWQNHAQLRYKYACNISDLDRKVKKCHEKLKVTRSQLIRNAIKNPEETCDTKKNPTAPMLEAYYRTHDDHIDAKEKLNQAEYDLSMAYNAVRAMDDRKFALQDCVKLYLNNYFSTPREERPVEGGKSIYQEIKEEKEKKQEKVQTAQRDSLKAKSDKLTTSMRRRRKK